MKRIQPSPDSFDLDAEAIEALEKARAMPPGPGRVAAMKEAGARRNAADRQRLLFAKRGRPPKAQLEGRAK